MKEKIQLVLISMFIIIAIIMISFAIYMKNDHVRDEDLLYSTIYYFGFGSRRVRIYTNGDVYDDLEIENPNHELSYRYLKTLDKDELNNLKSKINSESSNKMIEDYIIQLVYGVRQFDDFGGY